MILQLGPHTILSSKVSYIGPCDRDIKHHTNSVVHYFCIVTDGYLVKLEFSTAEECVLNRDSLSNNLPSD